MASSLVSVTVHIVFHVKSTSVKIKLEDAHRLYEYIGGTIRFMKGVSIAIGGMCDHIHILATLPKDIAITDYVRNIKANSSRWIKSIDSYYLDFAWQDGYGIFGVSPSLLDKTVSYIVNQERHHQRRSFQEEYKLFLQSYGINYDERYAFTD